jgi:MSHA biogenesis protein MshL
MINLFLKTCSRSSRAAISCGRTERRNRSLHGVNEDFEHRPTANGSGAVDLKQVLRLFSLITVTLLLSACSTVSPPEKSLTNEFFPETEAQKKPADKAKPLLPRIPPAVVQPRIKPKPATFNISIHETNARDFFMGLVVDTDENMLVHPEVSGNLSLELKNVTISQTLDAVQKVYGYDYQKTDIGYIIYPATLQTKIFKINHLDLDREGTSRTRVSSGQISSPRNSGDKSNTDNVNSKKRSNNEISGSSISTRSISSFWLDMERSLNIIVAINEQSSIVVNRQTGIIVVRAKPMQMREVEQFIKSTQVQIGRQVIIEAKILEVMLNDSHQSGINWANVAEQGTKLFFSSGASLAIDGATTLLEAVSPAIPDTFTFGLQTGDFTTFVTLLETQGKTKILSSPRISTLNNQKAVIKVGRDEYFITDVSSNTVSSGSSTITNPDITWTPFFSGIALDVTPQISENNEITLHIHPSITRVESQEKRFTINGEDGQIPLALNTVRESDSIVRAKNGQIIVIGGLMQESTDEDKRGIPFLTRAPYVGNLFRENKGNSRKSELVILLKPTVIENDQDWKTDMAASKQRLQSSENFQLWK